MVLLEAGVRRVPIVTTAVGGVPELIEDGVTGVLVPPGNSEAFAQAVARVLANPADAAARADALHARILESFLDTQMVARTAAVYAELLPPRGGSPATASPSRSS